LSIFQKSVEKVQVSLIYAINKGTIHKDEYTFLILSHSVLLRMRNVSGISCGENQHTHLMLKNFLSKVVLFMRLSGKILWSWAGHR